MNAKHLIILALVLALVLAMAGCTAPVDDTIDDTGDGADEETDEDTGNGEDDTEVVTGCIEDADCDDEDPCTTDSCSAGECSHTSEADCESVQEQEAYISEVDFGEDWIKVSGKNWDVSEWTIKDQNGTLFYKFPKRTTLNNYVVIYNEPGVSTTVDKYMSRTTQFWEAGDTAYLRDTNGNTKSQIIG